MDVRRDAFLAAARSALAFREDAAARDDVRATTGIVQVSPGIVTAFNGICELSLDQRALDADVLADMLAKAKEASERIAAEEGCEVSWERIWQIEPIPFNARAHRHGRRRDRGGRRRPRTGCRADRCTTPPRWRASSPP